MSYKAFLFVIVWMFVVMAVYASIAIHPVIRTAFYQWLAFLAVLVAPGVWFGARQLQLDEKSTDRGA